MNFINNWLVNYYIKVWIYFSRSRASNYQYSVWMIRNLWPISIIFFYVFFWDNIKVNQLLYCFIILLHLVSSFLLTRSLLFRYVYVPIESIDWILLSSFELKANLLISSVKTCLSLLNLCCDFIISFLFFMNSFWSF